MRLPQTLPVKSTRRSACGAIAGSNCARPMATSSPRPMSGPAKATSCRRASPTASSTRARAISRSRPAPLGWISRRPTSTLPAMSIRPYRDIVRRKSRQDHGRVRAGRRRRADHRPVDDQHADRRRRRRPSTRSAAARRPAPTSSASPARTRTRPRRCTTIVKAAKVPIVADIHFHYKRAIEAAEAGAACLRINPGNIGSAERVREVVQAARDHGCSMRIGVNAGSLEKRPAGEVRRALPGGDGRERARPRPHPAGPRLPRVQDQREGVRRLPGRRRLPAAGRGHRLPAASRRHRGGRAAHRHGEVRRSAWARCCGPASATPSASRCRPTGGGGQGRLRHAEVAGPAPPRRQHHLLPVLRAAAVRRDQAPSRRWRSGWPTSPRRCRCRSSAAW